MRNNEYEKIDAAAAMILEKYRHAFEVLAAGNSTDEESEEDDDEGDVAVFEEARREYEKDGKRSRPIQELWKELDLESENDVSKEIDRGEPVGKEV